MTLPDKILLIEALLLVALAFGILGLLGAVRVPLVTSRKVRFKDIAVSQDGWPERAKQVSNAFDNQFQLPVLFYAAVPVTMVLGGAGWLEASLGGLFVLSRYVHAFVHVTDNNIPRRFSAYTVGVFLLGGYWLVLAVRLVLA